MKRSLFRGSKRLDCVLHVIRCIVVKLVYPISTSELASIIRPVPPQCFVASPSRTTGFPLTRTFELPMIAVHELGPQHEECVP